MQDSAARPATADQLMEEGAKLEEQGRANDALKCYESALRLQPELALAYFKIGNIFLDRGQFPEALTAYDRALLLKPDSAGAHCNLGHAYFGLGKHEDAISAFSEALQLRPDFPAALDALHSAQLELAQTWFRRGLAEEDLRNTAEAIHCYTEALALQPIHALACNNLAGLLSKQGHTGDAITYLRRAVESEPDNAAIWLNLGLALEAQHADLAAASDAFERVIALDPSNVDAWMQLGNLQHKRNIHEQSVASLQQALRLDPSSTEALVNLSSALIELHQWDKAESACRDAIQLEPQNASAHNNLGIVLKRKRALIPAETAFRTAIQLKPDFEAAHINLGTVLHELGRFDAALSCYKHVLVLEPVNATAHSNIGGVLQRLGRYEEAVSSYKRALELNPDLAIAHNNIGLIYSESRRLPAALEHFHRSIELDPQCAETYSNLGGALKDLGQLDTAVQKLSQALHIDSSCIVAHNNLLFIQNYLAEQPREVLLADARRFGEVASSLAQPYTDWPNSSPNSQRNLRIGIVSGDLGNHPVGYFLHSVLAACTAHHADSIAFYGYSQRIHEDDLGKKLRAYCTGWCPTFGMTDEMLAQRIHQDGIDILIDLAGHTAHNRLAVFAWRPAPVQISWLGYFATTGLPAMDYFIADPWTLPPDQEPFFTEKVWRLPETRLCFTPPDVSVDVGTLPALSCGYITFGCFNNLSKMNDAVVQLWARILQAVPHSKLFLKYAQLAEPSVQQRTRERFALHGVDAQRLVFEDYGPRADYLAAYQRVDLALDPFPFPGGTTTVEALWMGVPVLTLQGERFLARQGVGLLMNAGLTDWVASDPDDYVTKAVAHASNLNTLATLRASLRQQVLSSPIYDAHRFANHFHTALRSMWEQWCSHTLSEEGDEKR